MKGVTPVAPNLTTTMINKDEIELIAKEIHNQWVDWSIDVCSTEKISVERVERWTKLWVDYKDLSEEMKDVDRKYARKILMMLQR